MTDIPEDIQATVDKIFYGLAVFDWPEAKSKMARAILAERERTTSDLNHLHALIEIAHDEFSSVDGGDLRRWMSLIEAIRNPTTRRAAQ